MKLKEFPLRLSLPEVSALVEAHGEVSCSESVQLSSLGEACGLCLSSLVEPPFFGQSSRHVAAPRQHSDANCREAWMVPEQ